MKSGTGGGGASSTNGSADRAATLQLLRQASKLLVTAGNATAATPSTSPATRTLTAPDAPWLRVNWMPEFGAAVLAVGGTGQDDVSAVVDQAQLWVVGLDEWENVIHR